MHTLEEQAISTYLSIALLKCVSMELDGFSKQFAMISVARAISNLLILSGPVFKTFLDHFWHSSQLFSAFVST